MAPSLAFLMSMPLRTFANRRFKSLKDAFAYCDTNGDGAISRSEFESVIATLDVSRVRKSSIDVLFELIDYDHNGEFDFLEFARVLTAPDVLNMLDLGTEA
jgi:Ca2+-binding EF-hand superfamily protein